MDTSILDTKVVKKLKAREKDDVKKAYLVRQGFVCPLCGGSLRGLSLAKLALDHCHDSGYTRGVLHMGCNRVDGIVKKAVLQWGRTSGRVETVKYIRNLADYLEESIKSPSRLVYPTHRTKEEELELKRKRMVAARKKAALSKKKEKK